MKCFDWEVTSEDVDSEMIDGKINCRPRSRRTDGRSYSGRERAFVRHHAGNGHKFNLNGSFSVSNHKAQAVSGQGEGIWGAYGYSEDMDVFRIVMSVSEAPFTFDQMTFSFVNMTQEGGTLALVWEDTLAR